MRIVLDTSVLVSAVRLLMELAFAAKCQFIITHNIRDFHGSEQLGITALTPGKFLKLLRGSHEHTQH
jgi:predicted nucleic acid-binding protein